MVPSQQDQASISRVQTEAQHLAFIARYRAECHVTAARFYSNVHTFVGMGAAGLAALAGGTAFAGATVVAGIAAIGAAVLAGFLTVHKPDERTQSHWIAARKYNRLSDDITLYHQFNLVDQDEAQAETGLIAPGREPHQLPPGHNPGQALEDEIEVDAADAASIVRKDESPVEALTRFLRECADLEDQTFPVPRHLCVSTENYISRDDEWYPPLRTGKFEDWRKRRAERHSRWRLPFR